MKPFNRNINMKHLTRYLSTLFHRKHVQIYAFTDSSLFHLILDDIWLLIVNEWLDHVRSLLLLEIAVGKQNIEKWIYGLSRRVSIPCEVNVEKFEDYVSWKHKRGLEKFEQVTIRCKNIERNITVPWNSINGVNNLIIHSKCNSTIGNKISLQVLLQNQPQLLSLSIPINYLKVSDENIPAHLLLTTLTLNKFPWTCEMKWRKILTSLTVIVPRLETLRIERCKILSFRHLLLTLHKLTSLKDVSVECSISSDGLHPIILPTHRRLSYFDFFPQLDGDDEDEEIHPERISEHNNPPSVHSTPLLDFSTMLFPWEKVNIYIETNCIVHAPENKLLFAALARCPKLHTLRLQNNLYFPRTYFSSTFPWNALTELTLIGVAIHSSQLCAIVQSIGHQLTSLTLQTLYEYPRAQEENENDHEWRDDELAHLQQQQEDADEEEASTPCRWVTLLRTHCIVLQTLRLVTTVFQEEPTMIDLLTPSRTECDQEEEEEEEEEEEHVVHAFASSLRHFELFQVNIRSITDPTMLGRLLGSYHSLETIEIRLDEVQCYSDILEILFTCCNPNTLKHFSFTRHRVLDLPNKSRKYLEHQEYLRSGVIFHRLETIRLMGVMMIEESIPYFLSHAPLLHDLQLQVHMLRKKTVILSSYPHDDEPAPAGEQQQQRSYERKDAYFEYDTRIYICSRTAIQALLQPPHNALLPKYLRKGGIFPAHPTSLDIPDYWWLPLAVRYRVRWNDSPPSALSSWIYQMQEDGKDAQEEEDNTLPESVLAKAETVFIETLTEEEYLISMRTKQQQQRIRQNVTQSITRQLFKKDKNKSLPFVYDERKDADGKNIFHIEQTFIQYVQNLKRYQAGEEKRSSFRWGW